MQSDKFNQLIKVTMLWIEQCTDNDVVMQRKPFSFFDNHYVCSSTTGKPFCQFNARVGLSFDIPHARIELFKSNFPTVFLCITDDYTSAIYHHLNGKKIAIMHTDANDKVEIEWVLPT